MSLGKNVVVHGATLKCSQSETMSFLKAKDLQMYLEGEYVATVDDHKPTVNIIPFGLCKHPKWKDKPCKPITPTPWKPGEKSVDLGNQVILDVKSECKCDIGGIISIVDSGQVQPFFTVDCVSYSNAALEFLRKRYLALKRSREELKAAYDEENKAGEMDGWDIAINTIGETGKEIFGDDPIEVGLNSINPWKKVKLVGKLKNLPGAIKDAVRALRGGGKGATKYDDLGKTAPCFLKGTIIQTPTGEKTIENLKQGDMVLAFDFEEKCTKQKLIVRIFRNWTEEYYKIITDEKSECILVTTKHLFWLNDRRKWIPAKELKNGMLLQNVFGETVSIKGIILVSGVDVETFNFEVDGYHNYYVGTNGVLVHNQSKPSIYEDKTKKPIKIYEVYDPKTGKTVYVGQTNKADVRDRFKEHKDEGKRKGNHKKDWGKYRIREVKSGKWTPYEAHVWEQHYIDKNGGKAKLQNKKNAIAKPKFDKYKSSHNPC